MARTRTEPAGPAEEKKAAVRPTRLMVAKSHGITSYQCLIPRHLYARMEELGIGKGTVLDASIAAAGSIVLKPRREAE